MMQAWKDSFYIALRDRLAARHPERTVRIGGEERPAIVVAENELVAAASPLLECFHLNWQQIAPVAPMADEPAPLLQLVCAVSYATAGTDEVNAQDRGRVLAALDDELLDICRPGRTEVQDLSALEGPPFAPGQTLFWSLPALSEVQHDGRRTSRTATVELFVFSERSA